jgi:hypothetical protein
VKTPTVGQAIELVRDEQFRTHSVADFVELVWANMQDSRYGAAWAKLWAIFMGMPAERKSLEVTMASTFTPGELAAARHAQQIANRVQIDSVDGEYTEKDESKQSEGSVEAAGCADIGDAVGDGSGDLPS